MTPDTAAFQRELADLSRKHGVWIESVRHGEFPLLRKAWGCERGYTLLQNDRGMGRISLYIGIDEDEAEKLRIQQKALDDLYRKGKRK